MTSGPHLTLDPQCRPDLEFEATDRSGRHHRTGRTMVQHQVVAVGIGEERHVAHAP